MTNISKFIMVFNRMEKIVTSNDCPWDLKYDLVFSNGISKQLYATRLMPDYCDPDTTCEEDVMAFYKAAKERRNQLSEVEL